MRIFSLLLAIALLSLPCFAQVQEPADIVALGANFDSANSPRISGTALYGHRVDGGLYSFTLIDFTSKTADPFTLQTAVTTGIAQHIRDVFGAHVYATGSAGVSSGASNVGGAFAGGFVVVVPAGQKGWAVAFSARGLKTSLSGPQAVLGVSVAYGR